MNIVITCHSRVTKHCITSTEPLKSNRLNTICVNLARQLDLAFLPNYQPDLKNSQNREASLLLTVLPWTARPGYKLELQTFFTKETFCLDLNFDQGKLHYETQALQNRQKSLIKALRFKSIARPRILDACAGFGRDALSLAAAGCNVTMYEKNRIVAAITQNALQRARYNKTTNNSIPALFDHIQCHQGDSIKFMKQLSGTDTFDAIYLDPMFPEKKSNAKVKKESRFLRLLATLDNIEPDHLPLLTTALQCPVKRVVLKRPVYAPASKNPAPSGIIAGKTTRYEIFQP